MRIFNTACGVALWVPTLGVGQVQCGQCTPLGTPQLDVTDLAQMLQDGSILKSKNWAQKENERMRSVSQFPMYQTETTVNISNRGNLTQSCSDKGAGIAAGTGVEGQDTYNLVPAGNRVTESPHSPAVAAVVTAAVLLPLRQRGLLPDTPLSPQKLLPYPPSNLQPLLLIGRT